MASLAHRGRALAQLRRTGAECAAIPARSRARATGARNACAASQAEETATPRARRTVDVTPHKPATQDVQNRVLLGVLGVVPR